MGHPGVNSLGDCCFVDVFLSAHANDSGIRVTVKGHVVVVLGGLGGRVGERHRLLDVPNTRVELLIGGLELGYIGLEADDVLFDGSESFLLSLVISFE